MLTPANATQRSGLGPAALLLAFVALTCLDAWEQPLARSRRAHWRIATDKDAPRLARIGHAGRAALDGAAEAPFALAAGLLVAPLWLATRRDALRRWRKGR